MPKISRVTILLFVVISLMFFTSRSSTMSGSGDGEQGKDDSAKNLSESRSTNRSGSFYSAIFGGDSTSGRTTESFSPSISANNMTGSTQSKNISIPAEKTMVSELRKGNYLVDKFGVTYPIQLYKTQSNPNDPVSGQWWLNSVGLPAAFDVSSGSYQTTLAIIDTGFALNHEEFSGRWYSNASEVGTTVIENPSILNCTDQGRALDKSCNNIDDDFDGIINNETGSTTRQNPSILNCTDQGRALDKSCNRIDDDNNGLVDDSKGWDFVSFYPSVQAGKTNANGGSTKHGTQVTGIAAATANNNRGIAGVDSNTKILPIQAINDDGYGDTITVSRAIRYAADQGADVISLSLGTPSPDSYLRQAIDYAISKGSVVVAASGNDGCDCIIYPANYEEVVAVGATDTNNQRAYFSSFGNNLDIVAPGYSMSSSSWSRLNGSSAYVSGISGTSFATPLVAGVLTTMKSHQPQASVSQLIGVLTERTNRSVMASNVLRTDELGYGLLDIDSVVQRVSAVQTPRQRYSFYPASGGNAIANYEPTKAFQIYQCEQNQVGTTSLYKLIKNSKTIYTISKIERFKAEESGYTSKLFSNGFCINLPTDSPSLVRSISIPNEFENRGFVKE